jgi:hypothetical protein
MLESEMKFTLGPLAIIALAASCTNRISNEERMLLEADKANKKLELMYLEEIRIAEENQDHDAYRYFLNEYFKVERLKIPPRLQSHPDYTKGGIDIKY